MVEVRTQIALQLVLFVHITFFAFASQATAVTEGSFYYRIYRKDKRECTYPWCGGYFLNQLNMHSNTTTYVAAIDISGVSEEAKRVARQYVSKLGQGLVIYQGILIPFPLSGPSLPDYPLAVAKLQVSNIYAGMPAASLNLGHYFYKISCNEGKRLRAKLLNTKRAPVAVKRKGSTFTATPDFGGKKFLDLAWQELQVLKHGAIFSSCKLGKKRRTIQASQVFIQLPVPVGPCTRMMPFCNETTGNIQVYERNPENLCFRSSCIKWEGVCSQYIPECGHRGYRLACWRSPPDTCNKYSCDPIFQPLAASLWCF